MAFERARRVLRAGLGEIGHRLEQLGFWGATETPDQSHEQAYRCCGDQQASKRVDEYPVFGRDLLGQEHAELRLEVEDTRDPDACADHAQTDQMILEVVLGEVSAFLACVDRGENRDRGQGQLLQDAGRVQRPDKGRAKFSEVITRPNEGQYGVEEQAELVDQALGQDGHREHVDLSLRRGRLVLIDEKGPR